MKGDWLRLTGLGWLLLGVMPVAGEVLTWKQGDQMRGRWLGLEDGWLTWQAEALAEPVRLWLPQLHSWEARPAGSLLVTEPMPGTGSVRLADGSVFGADLEVVEAASWRLSSGVAGLLTVKPAAVVEWLRREVAADGAVTFVGPAGMAGFVVDNRGALAGQSWEAVAGGSLRTRSIDQSLSLPLALPEKVRLDVWLRTEAGERPPQFRLKIRRAGQGVEVETWLEELVGLGEGKPERLSSLFAPQFAGVLCLDFKAKKAVAYDLQGKELMRWKVRGQAVKVAAAGARGGLLGALAGAVAQGLINQSARPDREKEIGNGLTLVNLGESLSLERLIVREWDGEPPAPRPLTGPFLETVDGQVHPGAVTALRVGVVTLDQLEVPLEEVLWLHAGTVPPVKKAEAAAAEPERGGWARFADGSFFWGELKGADAETVRLNASWSGADVLLRKEKLVSLSWYAPETGVGPPTVDVRHLDEWGREGGKEVTRGQWLPAAGGVPLWRPDGAERAVPIKESGGMQFKRSFAVTASGPQTLPALAHLPSGEALAVELQSWTEKAAQIRVPMAVGAPAQTLSPAEGSALEMGGPPLQPRGFKDPNWVQTRGSAKAAALSADRQTLTLEPGASFAHGSFLLGDQLSFEIGDESTYGALRLRFFCLGLDEHSGHVPVLIYYSGDTVYCGVEDAKREGQMVGNTNRIRVPGGKPCGITVNWSPKQMEMLVNGQLAFKQNLTEKSYSGAGIMLEPAGMWGNDVRAMKVSAWQLRAVPGARSRPVVEAEVKQWALQVPRRLMDDPPRHFLVGQNGDVLRGSLENINSRLLTLRSGLETLEVPRERVAMLILPKQWDAPPAAGQGPAEKAARPPPGPAKKRWWLTTTEGAVLHWEVTSFGPKWVEGASEVLGPCRLPAAQVVTLSTESPPGKAAMFGDWKWAPAPEPVLPAGASGASGKLVGEAAASFELDLVSGGKFKLAEAKGKVVVLDFWATWCGPCLKAMPEVMAVMKDLPADQVQLIGVNQAQSKQEVAQFLETRSWDLKVVLDTDQKVGKAYGVEGIPHTVVVGPDGKIVWAKSGYTATAAQELLEAIQKVLP